MSDWNTFQNTVIDLLGHQGWNVTREHQLGQKKVDGVIERVELNRAERLAVECKYYERDLDLSQVTSIYAEYLPLFEDNRVTGTLLVTWHDLSPAARTFCMETKRFTHLRYLDLLNSTIDFSRYVSALVDNYANGRLRHVYVEQHYVNAEGKLQ